MRTLPRYLALLLLAAPLAQAANPASGTLTGAGQSLSYTAGPAFAPNTTSGSANPTCSATEFCDNFSLNLNLPTGYAAANPRHVVKISALHPINQNGYSLYLLNAAGQVLTYSTSAEDPNTIALPATGGIFTVRMVPHQAAAETVTVSVQLVADETSPAAGIAPRYLQVSSPATLGNNTAAEMNIGFNPRTKKVMTLGYLQTLRTTFPEDLTPALPEVCDAQWEDVSFSFTAQNTNDPILFTDQQTGRTFVSQLQAGGPGQSLFAYSDDDGTNWTISPATASGGIDHQTVGGGPYSAGGTAQPSGPYPNAVYYCSQSIAASFCIRSDDGAATFGAPVVLRTDADCDGFIGALHGHIKVAADGTAYVPDRNCGGRAAVMVSTNSGASWATRRVPGATSGDGDPSVAIDAAGTVYLCRLDGDGRAHVTVSRDKGLTWGDDHDVAYAAGIQHSVFVTAVAGDANRAACAFLGTKTRGNFQGTDFTGLWYATIAMTYDGGKSWHTVISNPNDPVQGTGGICLGGSTCISNRNLLDFNGITLDHKGRVLFGFSDGCIDDCVRTGIPNQLDFFGVIINTAAKTTFLRQIGGRSLKAAFDVAEPTVPHAACLAGTRDKFTSHLSWRVPDHGGGSIARYQIYRGDSAGNQTYLATTDDARASFNDTTPNPLVKYWYRITALNERGEGLFSNLVPLDPSTVVPENTEPTPSLAATPVSGSAPLEVSFTVSGSDPDSSDTLASYRLDFGDGSSPGTGSFGNASSLLLRHSYTAAGRYTARLTVTDSRGLASSNTAQQVIAVAEAAVNAFEFILRNKVRLNTFITSEEVTLGGFSGRLAIRIDNGGQYRINGGAFTSEPGTVMAGDRIAVRHVSASTENTEKVSTVSVGSYSTPFRSITTTLDRVPDAFDFGQKSGQAPGTLVESVAITLSNYDIASLVAGPGLEYRINGGPWTRANGSLQPGQTLQVRHVSNSAKLGYTKSYLKAGGVTGYFTARTR